MVENKSFMHREIKETGELPDFQFIDGEVNTWSKESADEIRKKCQSAQEFFGATPDIRTVVISPSAESEKSSIRIEADTAYLELVDPDSARHEYSHAIIGPLCEKLSSSLTAVTGQKIIDSLSDEARKVHVGEDELPEGAAPRLLEEYLVRGSDTYLRVREGGGEEAVLAEANRKIAEAGGDGIKTFPELLSRDRDWQLRAFFYEQLKEFQRLKENGEINSIEEFLPTVIKNLEDE